VQIRIQIVSVCVAVLLLAVIFQLIRRNRLQEKYALGWIVSAVVLLVLSLWRGLLERFAAWVGIFYAPSALFLVALFCGTLIALHFSVAVSALARQNKTLAQEIALLKRATGAGRPAPRGGRKRRG
jgi:hypothetical protein